jgi:SAM-dependent methyltransferase
MTLTPQDWHERFEVQARWSEQLRRYLYRRAGVESAARILSVGCGTGALLQELVQPGSERGSVTGLDLNASFLKLCAAHAPGADLVLGDGLRLPFEEGSYDISLCHYLLLWVRDPQEVVKEMRRVTRSGGKVLALAEPDYGGRIDYPEGLEQLGEWQQAALRDQGADPTIGRRLASIFQGAGLRQVETGVLGAQWAGKRAKSEWDSEWRMLEHDFAGRIEESQAFGREFERLRRLDGAAWERGERVLYVPMFYAWGEVA